MYDKASRWKFRRNVVVDPVSGCWVWAGPRHPRGYGLFWVGGRTVYAHRYAYELLKGPIPSGLEVYHPCGNRSCCRPDHLELGTHAENHRKAAGKGVWRGSRNGNARRTEEEVLSVKRLNAMGWPATMISSVMRIPLRSVYSITSGEVWKHVELDEDPLRCEDEEDYDRDCPLSRRSIGP